MSLQRTNHGIQNEHLFYGVSTMVYCEGDVDNECTLDEMFWQNTLANFGLTCKCKSKGSKSIISGLAQQAILGGVKNVIFAMDRDYNDYYDFPIMDDCVIYTYGYSWENDVLLVLDAFNILSLFANILHSDSVSSDLNLFIKSLSDDTDKIVEMDIMTIKLPQPLYDRHKPNSIIDSSGVSVRFNETKVLNKFQEIIQINAPSLVNSDIESNWIKVFYGKACVRLIYQWFVKRASGYKNSSKVPYDVFLRQCIMTMKFIEGSPISQYYKNAINNFIENITITPSDSAASNV